MKVRVEVVCLNADGDEQRRQVLTIERRELAMETLGMNLSESKALLACVQDFVVAQQVREDLEQRRACPDCRRRYTSKDSGSTSVSTLFGRVEVPNPRWNRCACQTEGPQTFRPMRTWLNGQTSPEMLYLETKWASLIPFARAADLLKEVLPVGNLVNAESVRNHLQLTAERIERELAVSLKHTSAITASSSRTSASVDIKGRRSARPSWSRRSTKWSANDSSRSSRCSGRCVGPIFCCRPGRRYSTRIWTRYSAIGIRNSGRNHKRRNQSSRPLDPRPSDALYRNRGKMYLAEGKRQKAASDFAKEAELNSRH